MLALFLILLAGASEGRSEPQAGGWYLLALEGREVVKLVLDPSSPSRLDVLLVDGSHLASSDGGSTWLSSTDPRPFYARDPNAPTTYYRWEQRCNYRCTYIISKSQDDANTWAVSYDPYDPSDFLSGPITAAHALETPPPWPGIPSAVLASFYKTGYHYGRDEIASSTDGGASWHVLQYGRVSPPWIDPLWWYTPTKVLDFDFDLARGVGYAPASRSRGEDMYRGEVPPALLKSTDWMSTVVPLPLPPGAELMPSIATDPDHSGRLFLLASDISNTADTRNIWQTENEGGFWFSIRTGLPDNLSFHALALQRRSPNPNRLILATNDGLWFREVPVFRNYFPLVQRVG